MADGHNLGNHGGRASSWLAVSIMLAGFTVGGVGLTVANWMIVWVGVGIFALGGILALVFDIFSDVVIDAPRVGMRAEDHR
ncbi:HGxxPAAW family protein [Nonomuraea sp. NPDC059194]|uniref:HGxxPAAW family protein n=1 Tax=Nonomuraea sp. NPDC059194 TaxID=3346764 RepID=UPI0036AE3AEA